MTLDVGRRRIELLIRALSAPGLQATENGDAGLSHEDWSELVAGGIVTRLLLALCASLQRGCQPAGAAEYLESRYGNALRNHRYRAASQRRQLIAAVQAINATGHVPLLASGARELWLETPAWRWVEEIAVLLPSKGVEAAGRALQGLGWQRVRNLDVSGYGAESCWITPATTGYIALRGADSHRALEHLLPHDDVQRHATTATADGVAAPVLPPHIHCLHAVLCHHVSGGRRGAERAALKPLYEFATALDGMAADDRHKFDELVASRSAVQQIVERWLRAAHHTFGLLVDDKGATYPKGQPPPLVAAPDGYAISLDGAAAGRLSSALKPSNRVKA